MTKLGEAAARYRRAIVARDLADAELEAAQSAANSAHEAKRTAYAEWAQAGDALQAAAAEGEA